MGGHARLSPWGTSFAAGYLVLAAWAILDDRTHSSGGFINLSGILTWIVTLPVSLPLEWLGLRVDPRNNLVVGAAVLACTLLFYRLGQFTGYLLGKLRRGSRGSDPAAWTDRR